MREGAGHVRDKVRYVKARSSLSCVAGCTPPPLPLALAAGIVLIVLSPTLTTRVGSAVFAFTALLLFTVSALYHRGTLVARTWAFLRRFDHSNIFLLIAGSYTPFTLILLEGSARVFLLVIVWTGAALGVAFRIFWIDAPRWLYTPIYFALGWVAIFYAGDFSAAGAAVITLIAVGGGLYTLGGLVYGLKRPDPFPPGSASTRCSTPSRSPRSCATTWRLDRDVPAPMSGGRTIEAVLPSWIVESGEMPNLYVGVVTPLSLCAWVMSIDGRGKVPAGSKLADVSGTTRLQATVSWVENRKHALRLVVKHAGVSLAVEPAFAQGRRQPSMRERLRGYRGVPAFLPVHLPIPEVGQSVELKCHVVVMADYDLEEVWSGPRCPPVTASTGSPPRSWHSELPDGFDRFDAVPSAPTRVIEGLTTTRPPEGLNGETVSDYLLTLTPSTSVS